MNEMKIFAVDGCIWSNRRLLKNGQLGAVYFIMDLPIFI